MLPWLNNPPEPQREQLHRELKQQLLAQSGGVEAFVALAAPMLKASSALTRMRAPAAIAVSSRLCCAAALAMMKSPTPSPRPGCRRAAAPGYRAAPGASEPCWSTAFPYWCWAQP